MVSGRTDTAGTRLLDEKEHPLPLVTEAFDLAEISFPRVDQTGCAKVRTNSYSVPLNPGSIVEARVPSTTVEFRHHGTWIASHERCYSRFQKILDLEHYLDVLDPKSGALRGSAPLARELRPDLGAADRAPGSPARDTSHRKVIRLSHEFGYQTLTAAVESAPQMGCTAFHHRPDFPAQARQPRRGDHTGRRFPNLNGHEPDGSGDPGPHRPCRFRPRQAGSGPRDVPLTIGRRRLALNRHL